MGAGSRGSIYTPDMLPETPSPLRETPRILVLGRDTCEDTIRSLALLRRFAVPFTYLHVDVDPDADAWVRRLNGGEWRTPTILVGDDLERPDEVLREPSDGELSVAVGLG
jgi:glutaredoxin